MRSKLVKRAEALGFDSAQAMFRYIGQAVIDERDVTFGVKDDWGEPSPAAVRRLNRWSREARALAAAGKLKGYTTAEDFMRDLNKDIAREAR